MERKSTAFIHVTNALIANGYPPAVISNSGFKKGKNVPRNLFRHWKNWWACSSGPGQSWKTIAHASLATQSASRRRGSWRENIDLSSTFRMKDPWVSWLRIKFQLVFRYETVVFRRYVLSLLLVVLLRKFEAYLVYLSHFWGKFPRRFSCFQKFRHFVICFPVFPRELVTCAIVFQLCPEARFSKAPETFRARKAIAKSRSLWFQSWFIHVFLTLTEALFTQEVSGVHTYPFLDTDELIKNGFTGPKSSRGFRETGPRAGLFESRLMLTQD